MHKLFSNRWYLMLMQGKKKEEVEKIKRREKYRRRNNIDEMIKDGKRKREKGKV